MRQSKIKHKQTHPKEHNKELYAILTYYDIACVWKTLKSLWEVTVDQKQYIETSKNHGGRTLHSWWRFPITQPNTQSLFLQSTSRMWICTNKRPKQHISVQNFKRTIIWIIYLIYYSFN